MPQLNFWLILVVLVFILLDYISGVLKGVVTNDVSSTKMRLGLAHKAVYLLIIALAVAIEYAAMFVDFGFEVAGLIYVGVCLWIIVTEIASILENLCVINPGLKGTKIYALFGKAAQEGEEDALQVRLE